MFSSLWYCTEKVGQQDRTMCTTTEWKAELPQLNIEYGCRVPIPNCLNGYLALWGVNVGVLVPFSGFNIQHGYVVSIEVDWQLAH